ncbi:thioredoxin domain-containing protein [Maribacter sp. X9]|uniref:thioredoxin domain-containing protein n=1 Tax=Maribacter sp. X9 TaxID=3402159 RepID=UPI003AF3F70E
MDLKFTKTFSLISAVLVVLSCKNDTENQKVPKKDATEHEFSNALVQETSPYLLQHAHNPVNWKPWNDAAFEEAKKNNLLVVLSIGYSTCHWCHVMEEESFEDVEVAQLMNEKFISIKVDREERPDLDMVYQTALQMVNGTGGWPMNAIILPDGSPVYLGTYHEREDWKSILIKFSEEFERNPDQMKEYASMLANGVQEVYQQPSEQIEAKVTSQKVLNGVTEWSKSWDLEWGGDLGQQKFIIPTNLNMLLDYSTLQEDGNAKAHVLNTLQKISQGGIYDHIGGGFFRYSTDAKWKVPHFEKMLYDNAQMIGLLSKAYKVFGNKVYEYMVEQTFQFLKSEMRNEDGGYFSAMDADTNGEEGAYYTWRKDELQNLLGHDFEMFSKFYGINENEVWEDGKYVLFTPYSIGDFAKKESILSDELNDKIEKWNALLYENRQKKDTPSKDYKIITSWNALLIDGLIEAYKSFGKEVYLNEAKSIFEYLKSNNYKNKELVHSCTTNSRQKEVFLEDYALLAKSALKLYEVTLEIKYSEMAKELMDTAIEKYTSDSGLFYYNAPNEMIPKIINTVDGVAPSANAIMAQNLFWLGHFDYDKNYLKKAGVMGALLVDEFEKQAISYGSWGSLLLNQTYPYYEIAIVGENAQALITEMNKNHLVNTLLAGSLETSDMALFKDRFFTDRTLIYVCQNNTCKLPVEMVEEAFDQMKSFGYKKLNPAAFHTSL